MIVSEKGFSDFVRELDKPPRDAAIALMFKHSPWPPQVMNGDPSKFSHGKLPIGVEE